MRIISGAFKGRTIHAARSADDHAKGYRPATSKVRQAVFSMLQARGLSWQGLRALDLFAGTGSLGLEALSRGAAWACFMDSDRKAVAALKRTLDDFGLGPGIRPARAEIVARDVFAALRRPPSAPFGLVFVDPPYGRDLCLPALTAALDHGWIAPGALVLAEVEAGATLDPAGSHSTPALALVPETDRLYGQTRILLWRHDPNP